MSLPFTWLQTPVSLPPYTVANTPHPPTPTHTHSLQFPPLETSSSAFLGISITFYLLIVTSTEIGFAVFVCFEVDSHGVVQTGLTLHIPLPQRVRTLQVCITLPTASRFWFKDFLRLAPTLMGSGGHVRDVRHSRGSRAVPNSPYVRLCLPCGNKSRHISPSNPEVTRPFQTLGSAPAGVGLDGMLALLQGEMPPPSIFSGPCFLTFALVS